MGGKVIVKIPVLPRFCLNASGRIFVRTRRRPPPGPKFCPNPSDGISNLQKSPKNISRGSLRPGEVRNTPEIRVF